jgi:hypothetical protein
MPVRPTIPARQIEAICAALRPGQRAEITMPGGGLIRICGATPDDAEPETPAPTLTSDNVHDIASSIKARMAQTGRA